MAVRRRATDQKLIKRGLQLAEDLGWTYKDLAAELGCSVSQVYRWKRGTKYMQTNTAHRMMVFLEQYGKGVDDIRQQVKAVNPSDSEVPWEPTDCAYVYTFAVGHHQSGVSPKMVVVEVSLPATAVAVSQMAASIAAAKEVKPEEVVLVKTEEIQLRSRVIYYADMSGETGKNDLA